MKIKEGKSYLNRKGEVIGPMKRSSQFPKIKAFVGSGSQYTFHENGQIYSLIENAEDLMSEFIEEKDTIEVSKEFVRKAHDVACGTWQRRIEEELPEMFKKPELEVGKWYIVENTMAGCVGFSGIGMHTDKEHGNGLLAGDIADNFIQPNGKVWRVRGDVRPATDKEVEEALIREAQRRGLKIDVRLKLPNGEDALFRSQDRGMFFEGGNLYWHSNFYPIFRDGEWAEILPEEPKEDDYSGKKWVKELTLEEIAKKFNVPVNQLRIKD